MAVIKCTNCENEILDSEIVCPYCDCPLNSENQHTEQASASSALSGETVRISRGDGFEASFSANDAAKEEKTEETSEKEETQKPSEDDIYKAEPVKSDITYVPDDESASCATIKLAKDDIRSDALRRSLEERKAKRDISDKKRKKDHKIAILAVTIIGIFVIIYLIVSVFNKIVGEGLFEGEKESKKAEKEISSAAEMKDLGFEVHSRTLTIIDEDIIMTDYQAGDEKPWKSYKKDVTNLTIADGIETIGAHAFDDLKGLRHVTLSPSVATIGDSAFYALTKLEKLVFDSEKSELKSVGNYAFTDCDALETVTFGEELKRIGEGAFKSCSNLSKVTIPDATTEIGADAFLSCHNLTIVCSKDSYAYEYATQNGITVSLVGEEKEEGKEENTVPSSNPTEPKPTISPNENNQTGTDTPASTTPNPPAQPENEPAPEKTKEEKLSELMNKLANAKTQEESDNILKQIDELTK